MAKERIHTVTELHAVPKHVPDLVTFAVNSENDISSSSDNPGRSAERWRRLALLRAVPPEFRTPVDFKLALAAAGENELGLSFVGMFHFLLKPGEWREVHFANYQVPQRVWNSWRTRTKNKTPAGSRQSPARARGVSLLTLAQVRNMRCPSSSWPRKQPFHTCGFPRWRCH